ncbi:carbohydrate porin [Ginsengibacter hankyongi]|uniref:Carbohydrate porin n=1 Tax=Ginsengibacter hankyongi TaxID=2607284 RepID=A0A5J5IHI4_9BACT|nr:carbohydrate porin [Ginsengibacter hankyongi]KAA9038550.1 carbohydrate porin [Ginsengibacter hankyongi]
MIVTKKITGLLFLLLEFFNGFAQTDDSAKHGWTNHFQFTYIAQKHTAFPSKYSGQNSLADSVEPAAKSITATLFLGRKLWRGGTFYLNPEVSGGNGLSFATGVAGALNGETYRIGSAAPAAFIARAYFQQYFRLGVTDSIEVKDDANQISDKIPSSRITISAGKFSVSDFFDDNKYSKDPRSQFFNWALWANGAWDYPANTRGYTFGLVTELIKPNWTVRFSSVAVPRIANYHLMEYNFKAHSETIEFEHTIFIGKKPGAVRLIVSNTHSQAPSYAEGMKALDTNNTFLLNVIQGKTEHKSYGGKKFAVGLNVEQEITNGVGVFSRIGWNDGKHVTWAFTEIDRTANVGLSLKGNRWKRQNDVVGIATVINGISKEHRNYLKAGGYGFIIGDGKLSYANEAIMETFYNAKLSNLFWLTLDYQFVTNPGYNKDRGPAHVFGVRGHIEF